MKTYKVTKKYLSVLWDIYDTAINGVKNNRQFTVGESISGVVRKRYLYVTIDPNSYHRIPTKYLQELSTMNQEQQRTAIAEACGYPTSPETMSHPIETKYINRDIFIKGVSMNNSSDTQKINLIKELNDDIKSLIPLIPEASKTIDKKIEEIREACAIVVQHLDKEFAE